jgi:hypothetical protein
MVLGPYRQPFVDGIERRPLGHGPGCENSINPQPEIVMQMASGVFLDNKDWLVAGAARMPGRFWCSPEIPHVSVFLKWHRKLASSSLKSLLPHDFVLAFVCSQAQEPRVSKLAIRSPFREADLGHTFGLNPMHAPERKIVSCKRAQVCFQRVKLAWLD